MKKILLTMAFVLTALGNAWADDVTVSDIQIPQGKSALLEVSLVNPDYSYRQGMEFKLALPEGITVESAILTTRFKTATVQYNYDTKAGLWVFVAKSDDNILIANTSSDVVLKVQLGADESKAKGDYTGTISNIEVTRSVDETLSTFRPEAKTFNITVVDASEFRLVFDENDRQMPTFIDDEQYNVTVKRTIKANEWSTIILPFTLSYKKTTNTFGEDVQLAQFSGYTIVDQDDVEDGVIPRSINVKVTTVDVADGIEAGTPYFIKTSQDISSFDVNKVKPNNSLSSTSVKDVNGAKSYFNGTFVPATIPANGIFVSENKFWYSLGGVTTKAFRCWLKLTAVLDKEFEIDDESRIFMTFVDDEKTGIKEHKQYLENGRVYDLQGRRVSKTAKNGLYIKDGKKILVK